MKINTEMNHFECTSPNSVSNESTCNSSNPKVDNPTHIPSYLTDDGFQSENITHIQQVDNALNSHLVNEQFGVDNLLVKFPKSISNSKSMFIHVTLVIVCVLMFFDLNILTFDSNQYVGNARNLRGRDLSMFNSNINNNMKYHKQ